MTQCAAVMTNRSSMSAPPQKNSPSSAMATCHVCSPMAASLPPMILRFSPPPPAPPPPPPPPSRNSGRCSLVGVRRWWPPPPPPRTLNGAERLHRPGTVAVRSSNDRCCLRSRRLSIGPWPSQWPVPDEGVRCGDGGSSKRSSRNGRSMDDIPQSGDSETRTGRVRLG